MNTRARSTNTNTAERRGRGRPRNTETEDTRPTSAGPSSTMSPPIEAASASDDSPDELNEAENARPAASSAQDSERPSGRTRVESVAPRQTVDPVHPNPLTGSEPEACKFRMELLVYGIDCAFRDGLFSDFGVTIGRSS